MDYLIGVGLALSVSLLARIAGLDRDRAFYPTVMIVIASYMKFRFASINDLPIKEADRKFRWDRKV